MGQAGREGGKQACSRARARAARRTLRSAWAVRSTRLARACGSRACAACVRCGTRCTRLLASRFPASQFQPQAVPLASTRTRTRAHTWPPRAHPWPPRARAHTRTRARQHDARPAAPARVLRGGGRGASGQALSGVRAKMAQLVRARARALLPAAGMAAASCLLQPCSWLPATAHLPSAQRLPGPFALLTHKYCLYARPTRPPDAPPCWCRSTATHPTCISP